MSSLAKKNSVMDHFTRCFTTYILHDFEAQMTKWGNANKDIFVHAAKAQKNWRTVLENARLRKKAEDERDKMIMSLAFGMMTGVAFGAISTAVQAKIGHKFRHWVTDEVVFENSELIMSGAVSSVSYNNKLGPLVGSVIEQFEDKGGVDAAIKVARGVQPDYFSALSQMHGDIVTMTQLRTDMEKVWASTVIKGKGYLLQLQAHATEDWCDRMFLRPAHGNLARAKEGVETFLVGLYHSLRQRAALWNADPRITDDLQFDIEREIWAWWVLTKKLSVHKQRLRVGNWGGQIRPSPNAPWDPIRYKLKPGGFTIQEHREMFKAAEEVTMRLAQLGIVVPQNDKQIAALKARQMRPGTVDIDDAIDTPDESDALRAWARRHVGNKNRLAPKPRTTPRGRITTIRQLNQAQAFQ